MILHKFIYPERPQLLTLDSPIFGILSDSESWVAERKYNGSHVQVWVAKHARSKKPVSRVLTREGSFYTPTDFVGFIERYFETRTDLDKYLPLVLDGEARHRKVKGVSLKLMVYDVFGIKNQFQDKQTFKDRRAFLESIFPVDGTVGCPLHFKGAFSEVFAEVTKDPEIEGLVIKHLNSKLKASFSSAVDSAWMYKVRRPSKSYAY